MNGDVRVEGHFGEWLQGRLGPSGPVVLVTLPCPALAVTARRAAEGGAGADIVQPAQAERLFTRLGLLPPDDVALLADMPSGGGCGASTAGLVALARVAGATDSGRIATACLAAEGATDPLMLSEPACHLWAPREARSLGPLPAPPACDIVGGFFGPPLRTDPADLRLPDISDLVEAWRRAAAEGDRACLAGLAGVSAERTTALRGPEGDPTAALVRRAGALGHVRAHTGSARGLIFAPGRAPPDAESLLAGAGFTGILRFRSPGA